MDTEQPKPMQSNGTTSQTNSLVPVSSQVLKDLLGPIVQEVRELKELVHSDYNKLHDNYSKLEGSYSKLEDIITSQQQVISKLETTISTKQKEVADDLLKKIEENSANIKAYISENKRLTRENTELKERLRFNWDKNSSRSVVLLHCGCLSLIPFIEFSIRNNSSSSDVLNIQASISISPKFVSK